MQLVAFHPVFPPKLSNYCPVRVICPHNLHFLDFIPATILTLETSSICSSGVPRNCLREGSTNSVEE
jgi:hypothetical protein